MSVNLEDRPIETVRSEVIDQLIMNYSHGEISYEAFDRRLDQAMELANHQALVELTSDLPLAVDKAFVESKKQDLAPNFVAGEAEEVDTMINIFSSSNRGGAFRVANEIRYFSLFSSTKIDFTDAVFSQQEVRIKIFSLFSSDTIYVPENINVASKAFCIFASIDNSAPNNGVSQVRSTTPTPTIIIEGFSIFSSVNIDLKRSMKEKFIKMADSFKKMFS
ncbi:LiaF domain-containing protein [Colwellia sp. TT2012]|uniref:LiaF domain-containing protein n=1 Tax=Colwellia sp. TT2012 TaxID=1720342 RepID=UPI00070CCDD7|nr:LiaF domain-containing protein [Colwellia sp. TT2012]